VSDLSKIKMVSSVDGELATSSEVEFGMAREEISHPDATFHGLPHSRADTRQTSPQVSRRV